MEKEITFGDIRDLILFQSELEGNPEIKEWYRKKRIDLDLLLKEKYKKIWDAILENR